MLAPNLPFAQNRNLWKSSTVIFGLVAVALSPLTALAQETTEKTTRLEKLTVTDGTAETIAEDNDTVVPTRNISALKTDTPLVETPRAVSVVTRKELEERGVQDMIQATRYTAGVTTGAFGFDPRFDQIYIRGISTTTDSDFRDGLRQPYMNYSTFSTEVYTLDRIEILKGPVSVMYGAASAAGIVNRISKMPLEETHREVELQYGTIGRAQAAFDFGGPAGDGIFYRLVGLARDAETNYDIADDRYLLQPSFTWKPDEATSLTIYGLAQKGETDASPRMLEHDGKLVRYSDPDYDHQKVTQYQIGYQLEHEFDNGLTFRQNARVSDVDLEARYIDTSGRFDVPAATSYTTTAVTDEQRAYQIDNQLEAKFETGAVSHTLLAGLDYTWITSDFGLGFGTITPAELSSAPTPDRTYFSSRDLRQTGVYAQEQAEFGNWRAVGGLRYDWVDQTNKEPGQEYRKDDGALSGQAGLLYLFDTGIAPYVSYGTSFVPSTQRSADGTILDPTEGEQIEVGVKYQPEGENYSLTAAAYRLVESGKPLYVPAGLYYKSSGENTYKGFELEGRTELDNGISLIAAYTYNHAEITGNVDSALIGNTPYTTPRHTTSLWVNYAVQEDTQLAGLALGAGVRVISESFTSDQNTDRNPGAAYLDASLSYDFGKRAPQLDGLSLAISATNLADRRERVCTDGYCYYGQGRTVLGSLKYKW